MDWAHVLRFGAGLARGLFNEHARRTAAAAPLLQEHSSDFGEHMQHLARATGLHLVCLRESAAAFALTLDDFDYTLALYPAGAWVVLAINSSIDFPPGRVPSPILRAVSSLSDDLPNSGYDIVHADTASFFCVKGRIEAAALTPDALEAALNEMAPAIVGVDRALVRRGLARRR